MPEPLKNQFGFSVAERIASAVTAVHPDFDRRAFLEDVRHGYDALELMPRARHIADALRRHLPRDYPTALRHLLAAVAGGSVPAAHEGALTGFVYLPVTLFIGAYGLEHFSESMDAQRTITKLFSAEFSIRPYLERYPEESLALLRRWATDPDPRVRRLVSEGTRPRLPWAPRLKEFQRDPAPVLALLELLKDDPDLVVRRSVANNLNDIGKDHPDVLVETARRWMRGADQNREWIVRHALRSAIKRGDTDALALLGFGTGDALVVRHPRISPKRLRLGDEVIFSAEVHNTSHAAVEVAVDFRIHYVKANGRTNPKVFKLTRLSLEPDAVSRISKRLLIIDLSTRRHYAGRHSIDLLLNGTVFPIGAFHLE
ncbi:MAG: DNA alkylation repair protein [Ignavibacteriae bacterium]|nr:DNA alkylation repair protein [Ignavibacteriota bacterium]